MGFLPFEREISEREYETGKISTRDRGLCDVSEFEKKGIEFGLPRKKVPLTYVLIHWNNEDCLLMKAGWRSKAH